MLVTCGALAGVLLTSPVAVADDAPLVSRVTYRAPPECPDLAAFKERIRRRTTRFVEDEGRAPSFDLAVSIATTPREVTGTLEASGPRGKRSRRALTGASCVEVTDALALMAALVIDPLAILEGHSPPPPPPPPPVAPPLPAPVAPVPAPPIPAPPIPAPPIPAPPIPAPPIPAPPIPAPPIPAPPIPAPPVAARPSASSSLWQFAAGGGADVSWGVTPDVLVGPRGFLEATRPSALLGLSLRVGFERASASDVPGASGTASFTWTFGTIDACPLEWTRASLSLSPCVRVEAGELDGTGVVTSPREATRGWFALALLGRARFRPFSHLAFEIEAGGRAPLIRDTFVFEPNVLYYQPPAVAGVLGGNVRVTL